jgi:endoglycosylceramidase
VHDSNAPIVPPNLNLGVLTGLTRPYAPLVNGTPTTTAFDSATGVATIGYSTTRPDGERAPRWRETVVVVPKLRYPDGYRVTVEGATVTSHRCARTVTLRNHHGADAVSVTITPATNCR